jgi:hypothetical protein
MVSKPATLKLVGGIPTPLKKYEFVSWDDDIPKIWENHPFMFQSTNQYSKSLEDTGY